MRDFGRTTSIALTVALIVASCGGTSDSSAETTTTIETAISTTTTEAATTTTEAITSTTMETTTTSSQVMDESTTTTDHAEDDDHSEGDDHADVDRTVEIVMTDFAFEPEQLEVSSGETIRFVVINAGAVDHEFRLSNAHRIEEHLASGHEDHDHEEGHHEGGDVFIVLEPDETGELVVTFPEDTTVYTETACLLPGHYEAGMKGTINYTDS